MTDRSVTPHAALLDYAGFVIRVETSDRADLEWLLEFVSPDFETGEAASVESLGASLVSMHRDASQFDEMFRRGAHPSRRSLASFSLDGQMDSLPLWAAADERVVVFDERIETFFRRQPGSQTIDIVARPNRPAARIAPLRAVREIASAAFIERGGLVLHAAAVAWQGKGVVIAGSKGAGKTTLLLQMLFEARASFVAGDRSAITSVDSFPTVRGMPTIVNVRSSTFTLLPHLSQRFAATRDHHRFRLSETGGEGEESPRASWSLTPGQLTRLLGVDRSGSVPLAAIVFLRRTEKRGGIVVRRQSSEEAPQSLQHAVFSSGRAPVRDCLFEPPQIPPSTERWPGVPCFDCALGNDAYAVGNAAAMLDRVIESSDA